MTINNHIVKSQKESILCAVNEEAQELASSDIEKLKDKGADCILVLGAGIKDDETPTPMLKDRLDLGIMLYEHGVAPKLLLSGDNGTESHNEIHVMLNYVRQVYQRRIFSVIMRDFPPMILCTGPRIFFQHKLSL